MVGLSCNLWAARLFCPMAHGPTITVGYDTTIITAFGTAPMVADTSSFRVPIKESLQANPGVPWCRS